MGGALRSQARRLTTARAWCHHRARDATCRERGGRDGAAGGRYVDPTAARRLRGASGDRRPVRNPGNAQRGIRLRREQAPLRDRGHRLALRLEGGAGGLVDRPVLLRPACERGASGRFHQAGAMGRRSEGGGAAPRELAALRPRDGRLWSWTPLLLARPHSVMGVFRARLSVPYLAWLLVNPFCEELWMR